MLRSGVMRNWTFLALGLLISTGCAPKIGDSCGNSGDCSATGDRQCDVAQPGGYCTVQGCDPDTCPGSTLCVEWRFNPGRTAETWCMKPCSGGECRREYQCVRPSDIRLDGTLAPSGSLSPDEQGARIIDLEESAAQSTACIAVVTDPPPSPDGPDAGM